MCRETSPFCGVFITPVEAAPPSLGAEFHYPITRLGNTARRRCQEASATYVMYFDIDLELFPFDGDGLLREVRRVLGGRRAARKSGAVGGVRGVDVGVDVGVGAGDDIKNVLVVPAFRAADPNQQILLDMHAVRDPLLRASLRSAHGLPPGMGLNDVYAYVVAGMGRRREEEEEEEEDVKKSLRDAAAAAAENRRRWKWSSAHHSRVRDADETGTGTEHDASSLLLMTKAGVKRLYDAGKVTRFQGERFPRGHKPTNFTRWFDAEVPYRVMGPDDKFPAQYEPWVIQRGDQVIPLDESFVHYGFNKAGCGSVGW